MTTTALDPHATTLIEAANPPQGQAETRPEALPPVDRPRDAWLGPIGGLILAFLVGAVLGGTTRPSDPSVEVVAYIPSLVFLLFIGYGIVKTAQCFQAARHPIHGVLGVIAAGAGVAWAGVSTALLLGLI
ncbi:MAG: hypothetical protein AAGI68_10460 [Planctomycetota bacterium]